jgi:hypothetical protein
MGSKFGFSPYAKNNDCVVKWEAHITLLGTLRREISLGDIGVNERIILK